MQEVAAAVPMADAASSLPARPWPKRKRAAVVLLALVAFLLGAGVLFVHPPTAGRGRHPVSWLSPSAARSFRGTTATHRPSAVAPPPSSDRWSPEERSFLELVRRHEERARAAACAEGKHAQRLYVGLDIGSVGARAMLLLQCDGADAFVFLGGDKRYKVKIDDEKTGSGPPDGISPSSGRNIMRDCTTATGNKEKCESLAADLVRGVVERGVIPSPDAIPSLPHPVDVVVFGYATAGGRTQVSAKRTVGALKGFKGAVERLEEKLLEDLPDRVKTFTVRDIRVLHGWEEAELELHAVARVLAAENEQEGWEEMDMVSFGGSSAQMAIRIGLEGDERTRPSTALLERWVKDFDASKTAEIESVADLVNTMKTQYARSEPQGDDRFLACGASERHFGDYLHILEHAPGAHLLVSFLGSENENCAPQHFGNATAEVGGDHQVGEIRDGPPCRARDLSSPEDSRHKGYSHLAGGMSAASYTFDLWARKCLESETAGLELTRDLKKMLCSCRFGGALKPGTCEDVDILGEGESTETAGQRDRAKIFLQCQAAMETFFWWDDQAVFMAELLAEIGPTGSEGTGEHIFHAAGGLGLVTLGLPLIADAALIDKCPPGAATQTKTKIESGDVTGVFENECLLAMYWRDGNGAFQPKAKFYGDGGKLVVRALLRILGFGDGQPGVACGPRGGEANIMQRSSLGVTRTPESAVELSTAGGVASSFLEQREREATFAADESQDEKIVIGFETIRNRGGDGASKLLVSGQGCLAVRDPRRVHGEMSWIASFSVSLLDQMVAQGRKIVEDLEEEARKEPGPDVEADTKTPDTEDKEHKSGTDEDGADGGDPTPSNPVSPQPVATGAAAGPAPTPTTTISPPATEAPEKEGSLCC
mmetsp:Transcript_1353/g.3104  ORF Transcript_1353/g.3104 Transcript_1353/m.3104 type:complete len:881 (-) Transcript_1353:322-2964(-)